MTLESMPKGCDSPGARGRGRLLESVTPTRNGRRNLRLKKNRLRIAGGRPLAGPEVTALDVSGALVLAGPVADREAVIRNVEQIDRGHENLEGKLAALGARVSGEGC